MKKLLTLVLMAMGCLATQAQTDMTSLLVNPDFEETRLSWQTNGFSRQGNNDFTLKHNSYYAETWSGGGTVGDLYMQQQLTDLPAGTYTLKAVCQNILQSNTSLTCEGAWIYANDNRTAINKPAEYSVKAVVTDGTLTLGARTESCTGNYVCFDNFRLTYEFVYSDLEDYLQDLINQANNADKGDSSAARTELIAARDALQSLMDKQQDEGMEQAAKRLEKAIEAYGYAEVSTSNPMDMTDRIENPGFEDGMNNWQNDGMQTQGNTAFKGKVGNTYCERWTSTGNGVGNGSVSQTIKKLPNGCYKLTANAQNIQENQTYKTQSGAYVFAETSQTKVTTNKTYTVEFVVLNGSATIGFKMENATGNYCCVDNFQLSYLGRNATKEAEAMNTLLSNAETLSQKDMNTDVRNQLTSAISIARNADDDAKEDAITALKLAMQQAESSNALYVELNSAITSAQNILSSGGSNGRSEMQQAITTAQTLYNSGNINRDNINQSKTSLENAILCYRVANGTGSTPTVTTGEVIVGSNAMVGRMQVSGNDIVETGFCWAENPNPTIQDYRSSYNQSNDETNWSPVYVMYNVAPSTELWVRAYAFTKTYAIGYGEPVRVMTLPKGETAYTYLWNGDDDHNEWLDNAMREATAYYNTWTAIKGFHPTANYSPGTETADCSYGGWINVGPWRCNTPTMVHEMMHGTGVGQHWRYWDSNLKDGIWWQGERANRVTHFFENYDSSRGNYNCNGDGMHICYEGNGNDMQQIRSAILAQALYEDGLPAVGDGACPFYSFEEKTGEKYYLTNDAYNKNAKYLCVKDGKLQYMPVSSNAQMKGDDSFAWYVTYDKLSAFYRFQNVKTGKYFSFSSDGSKLELVNATGTTTQYGDGPIYGSKEQIHLMPARISTPMVSETKGSFQAKPYWIARSNRDWQPEVFAVSSVSAQVATSVKQDFSNSATSQFWYILSAEELPAVGEVETRQDQLGAPWQKLTSMPDNMGDYFYAIYDSKNWDAQLGMKMGHGQNNNNKTMIYTSNITPATDKASVWAFEPFKKDGNVQNATGNTADCFILSNVGQPSDMLHSGEPWYYRVENNCEGWPDRGYVIPSNEMADDEWMLWNNQGNYIGPWNDNVFADGNEVAGNKSAEKAGAFNIYAITRGKYMQMVEDLTSASGENPLNVTYLIRNADARWRNRFHDNFPIGWTVKEGSNTDAESIFKVKTNFDMSGKSRDNITFEAWQGSGNLSDRSMSQTLTDLPDGHYVLTVTTDTEVAGAYLYANSVQRAISAGTNQLVVEVTKGSLTLGVKLVGYKSNWLCFDNFQLQYIGSDTEIDPSAVKKVLADGTYYLYNNATNGFLGRGYPYGTGAVISEYGAAVNITTDETGDSQIKFSDSKLQFVYDGGWLYTDSGNNSYFTVSQTDGGYMFLCQSGKQGYLATWEDGGYDRVVNDGPADRTSAVWTLMTVDEYLAYIQQHDAGKALQEAKKADANLNDLSSLGWYFDEEKVTLSNATELTESYQEYCSGNWDAAPFSKLEKTVNNLPAGIYRLSVNAFERTTWFDDVIKADGARGACYIEVNGVKANVKSITEESSATKLSGSNSVHDGYYYPNDISSAKDAFAKGMYENHVYVYLPEAGSITYKMVVPNRLGNDGDRARWLIFQNFRLNRLVPITDGDVNADGRIDTDDIEALSSALLNKGKGAVHPDVNRDGKVSISDQTLLIRKLNN